MKRIASTIIPIALAACGHVEPGYIFVPADAKPDTCLSAWDVTEESWAELIGDVSDKCARVDRSVTVHVTAPDEMPCSGASGCSVDGEMHISSRLSWHHAPSVAVHEWVHLLALCETGDGDAEHTDVTLWAGLDPKGVRGDTVEALAVRTAPHGPCLGDPMGEPLP